MNRRQHRHIPTIAIAALLLAACDSGTNDDSAATTPPGASSTGTAAGDGEIVGPSDDVATETTVAELDKAGNVINDDPTILTMAWYGNEGQASGLLGTLFADAVSTATQGQVTVDIQYEAVDPWQQYEDGEVDVLLSPARSLDVLGVHSFDALVLPFVVNDDEQADRVATSASATTMLEGLSAIGSTGLALAPVDERHLVVQGDEPLRSLDQLNGGIRVPAVGELQDDMFTALGFTPVHGLGGDEWAEAVADGSVTAAWTSTQVGGSVPGSPRIAANFALGYEFNVLLIHDDVLTALGPERSDAIRTAGQTAQQQTIEQRTREPDAFRNACDTGAELRVIPMPLISEIGRKLVPFVLETINSDPATKSMYEQLNRTAGVHSRTWPDECSNGTATPYEPPLPPSTTFPEGTYRSAPLPAGGMLAAGVGNDSAASNDGADYGEIRIANGEWTFDIHGRGGELEDACAGTYTVDADGLLDLGPPRNCPNGTFTWSTTDDGIVLEMTRTDDPVALIDDWDVSTMYGIGGHLFKVD